MHATYEMKDDRQKAIYYINSLLWDVCYRQIHPDRKQACAGEMESDFQWVSLGADKNVLELDSGCGCTTLWIY